MRLDELLNSKTHICVFFHYKKRIPFLSFDLPASPDAKGGLPSRAILYSSQDLLLFGWPFRVQLQKFDVGLVQAKNITFVEQHNKGYWFAQVMLESKR